MNTIAGLGVRVIGIGIFITLLFWIVGIIPEGYGFPTAVHTSFSTLGADLALVNFFLPVEEMLVALGLTFVILGAVILIWVAFWSLSIIRRMFLGSD
ncbi:MAG: hypothetical protein [Inoviridae sp.]|nr:MAG: hypothetical protein [Inoviridae sp.]